MELAILDWLLGRGSDAIKPVLSNFKFVGTTIDHPSDAFYIVRIRIHSLIQAMVLPPPCGCSKRILRLFKELRVVHKV